MTTIRFGSADLGKVRFAISPLCELWQSVAALQDPATKALHLPWLAESQTQLRDLDLSLLYALRPPRGLHPDFIHPPPIRPVVELDEELERLLATPPERVRSELSQCRSGPQAPVLSRLAADPDDGLAALADLLRTYWRSVLAPHWERIKAVLEQDILHRARQTVYGGTQALFADLHEMVRYADSEIVIDWGCPVANSSWNWCVRLDGRGLLLVPSVFMRFISLMYEPPWQPTIIYSARGTGLVWESVPSVPDALAALIGGRRAAVLALLETPRSTTELARHLKTSAGNVSQHLSVLSSNGLVSRHRVGRIVLYGRSAAGELLATRHTDVNQTGAQKQLQSW